MIQVTCACGATMQVQDENAGKQCKCPKCGVICQIPAAAAAIETPVETAAPAAPAPAAAAPAPGGRPGGLTAMAVLNFVFGGILAIIFVLALIGGAVVSSAGSSLQDFGRKQAIDMAEASGDAEAIKRAKAIPSSADAGPSMGMFYLATLLGLAVSAFLIVSGVGYIKQSKKSGFVFGNVYGIMGVVLVLLSIINGGSVLWTVVIWLPYPVITLALLNTKFKESFPNP